jgi:DNA-binding MarR family transcriptional regulator
MRAAASPFPDIGLDDFLCFAIYSAEHAFTRVYRRPLERFGLTYPQYLVMAALWGGDGVSVGALGERLSLDTNTLTPLLKRLEAMGLLTRRRSATDERRVVVALTDKGRVLRKEAGEVMRCVFEAIGLPAAEVVRLTGEIRALRTNLERAAAAA